MSEESRDGPRAVLFDIDDTLYDYSFSLQQAMSELRLRDGRLKGIPIGTLVSRDQGLLREVHVSMILTGKVSKEESRIVRMVRLYESFGLTLDRAEATTLATFRHEAILRHQRAVPGAQELLVELRSKGVFLGVVSNNLVKDQIGKLKRLGMEESFDSITISEEVGVKKPDPAIFLTACDRLKCSPADVILVGDSWDDDVLGARSAGIRAVWFNRAKAPVPIGMNVQQLESFEDLENALQTILAGHRSN
ncbi:MAG: HAD family hydrolase [Thermoplasmataceae archaeon]